MGRSVRVDTRSTFQQKLSLERCKPQFSTNPLRRSISPTAPPIIDAGFPFLPHGDRRCLLHGFVGEDEIRNTSRILRSYEASALG